MTLSDTVGEKLAQFLLEVKKISLEQLRQAEKASRESGKKVVDVLIEYGYTNESDIVAAISDATGIPVASEDDLRAIPAEVIALLSPAFITQNRILPIASSGSVLRVALAEPGALSHINGIRTLLNMRVAPCVVPLSTMSRLLDALDNGLPTELASSSSVVVTKTKNVVPRSQPVAAVKQAKVPDNQDASQVVQFVNNVIIQAVTDKASDIHIETFKASSRIRYRLDGVLHSIDKHAGFLHKNYAAVTTRLKIMANLDIAERRLPQDGAIGMVMPNGNEVDFRVSILPTGFGERVVMRILDRNAMSLDLSDLGIPPLELERFHRAIESPQGLVLVTGPTGSGKTTTLYGALRQLNQPDINILTAEDPIEFMIEGLGQVHVREDIGLTFAAALRSFLRQDPEIILVGEIRDLETAEIAIKAALTGHLVLSTLHTNDALGTISRLANMGIPGYLIANALTAVVAQRLARKNCTACSEPDSTVSPQVLQDIGFSVEEAANVKAYKGNGCAKCSGSGYKGRIGIYEVLPIGEQIKGAITTNADLQSMRKIAVQEGFRSMQDNGRSLVVQGVISVAEYERNLSFD